MTTGDLLHADYLNITVPIGEADSVIESLRLVFSDLGLLCVADGDYTLPTKGGRASFRQYMQIMQFSFSGQILKVCRDLDLLGSLLSCFFDVPHRVTRLDIAHDTSESTPYILKKFYASSKRGDITFSRKAIDSQHIKKIISASLYGGSDTGTLYIGSRKHDVSLTIYDKRQERFANTGSDIGYNLTRYELRLSRKVGMSLRDVFTPECIFWQKMEGVLERPVGVPEWVSSDGGFEVSRGVPSLPAVLLKRRVEASADLKDIIKLADQAGVNGRAYLLSLLSRLIEDGSSPLPMSQTLEGK
jgi:hypothetical protein